MLKLLGLECHRITTPVPARARSMVLLSPGEGGGGADERQGGGLAAEEGELGGEVSERARTCDCHDLVA